MEDTDTCRQAGGSLSEDEIRSRGIDKMTTEEDQLQPYHRRQGR